METGNIIVICGAVQTLLNNTKEVKMIIKKKILFFGLLIASSPLFAHETIGMNLNSHLFMHFIQYLIPALILGFGIYKLIKTDNKNQND